MLYSPQALSRIAEGRCEQYQREAELWRSVARDSGRKVLAQRVRRLADWLEPALETPAPETYATNLNRSLK